MSIVLKEETESLRKELSVDFIIFAILFKGGKPIKISHSGFGSGRAPGSKPTRSSDCEMGDSSHAERDCLSWLYSSLSKTTKKEEDIKRKASKYSLYIYRVDKHGELASAGPCSRCASFIRRSGIKKVYYTTKDHIIRADGRTIEGYTKQYRM